MRAEFWNGMSLLKRLYSQSMEPVCTRYGITRMELDVLLFLANNPEFDTATDIVEQRRLTKSHVSSSVASLEERGYLERVFYPGNRRTAHLKRTSLSEVLVSEGRQAQRLFFSSIFSGFSPEEIEELERSFIKIACNVRGLLKEES